MRIVKRLNRFVSVEQNRGALTLSELRRGRGGPLIAQLESLGDELFLPFVEVSAQLTIAEEKLALGTITAN